MSTIHRWACWSFAIGFIYYTQARFLMGISKIPENPAKLGNKVDKFIKWWDKGTGGYMYSKK